MGNDKLCKLCEEPLPKLALHFSNQIAIEFGYCSWMCMSADLGDKAYVILGDKSRQKMHDKAQVRRSGQD